MSCQEGEVGGPEEELCWDRLLGEILLRFDMVLAVSLGG